ncbi:hypothetical protein ACJX0J_020963, partial [Zea mays]
NVGVVLIKKYILDDRYVWLNIIFYVSKATQNLISIHKLDSDRKSYPYPQFTAKIINCLFPTPINLCILIKFSWIYPLEKHHHIDEMSLSHETIDSFQEETTTKNDRDFANIHWRGGLRYKIFKWEEQTYNSTQIY